MGPADLALASQGEVAIAALCSQSSTSAPQGVHLFFGSSSASNGKSCLPSLRRAPLGLTQSLPGARWHQEQHGWDPARGAEPGSLTAASCTGQRRKRDQGPLQTPCQHARGWGRGSTHTSKHANTIKLTILVSCAGAELFPLRTAVHCASQAAGEKASCLMQGGSRTLGKGDAHARAHTHTRICTPTGEKRRVHIHTRAHWCGGRA